MGPNKKETIQELPLIEEQPLMHIPRKFRRLEAKRIKQSQTKINFIAQEWVNDVLENGMNFKDEVIFNRWNNVWKGFAKILIRRYSYAYNDKKSREKVIGHFESFAKSIIEKKPPTKEVVEVKSVDTDEIFAEIRKDLKGYGVKTTSNTVKGLQRVISKRLDPKDQLAIRLNNVLTSVS